MFNEIIVVEGVHDKQRLESIYPDVTCIVTNGSEIADTTIELIINAAKARGVILFLDPDHPGKKITNRIVAAVPDAKIAFLSRRDAVSPNGRKVGVEHASADAIKTALSGFHTIGTVMENPVNIADLVSRGLAGSAYAAKNRERLAERLGLPVSNAKTLLKWLNILGISAGRLDG